jgi:UDP-2,3-diacylglucosamine hydrolase
VIAYGRLPDVEIPHGSLVIADLHLDLGSEASTRPFLAWLEREKDLSGLVILGDLFDVWVGPAQETMPGAPAVIDALRGLAERGTPVHLVHGNRDFLLDRSFAKRTGARIHPLGLVGCVDRSRGGLPPRRVVLIHGDELCTRDKGYQRLKRLVRSRMVTGLAPRLPLPVAEGIARALRRTSVRAVAAKPPHDKAVQESAARWKAEAYHADAVVCGHAHAFRDMRLSTGPRWIVLDAFGGDRDVLEIGADGELRPRRGGGAGGAGGSLVAQ